MRGQVLSLIIVRHTGDVTSSFLILGKVQEGVDTQRALRLVGTGACDEMAGGDRLVVYVHKGV